jgi:hypothetical protein
VGLKPTSEGVNVDLYIFREDFHIRDGTILADNYDLHSLYGNEILFLSDVDKKESTQIFNHHIQGKIEYPIKQNKIKSGTGTGMGGAF